MAKDVVEVSVEIALSGLYTTPDMRFFSMFADHQTLQDAVQTIIHSKQPLTSSYADYGDYLYESFHSSPVDSSHKLGAALMNLYSFTDSHAIIDHALNAIVEVAMNILKKTNNVPEDPTRFRIIPHELEHLRFTRPLKITRENFHEMFMCEPWLSWIELMRGQMERNQTAIANYNLAECARFFRSVLVKKGDPKTVKKVARRDENDLKQAKKAITRAYKLHERLFGVHDVKRLVKHHRVTIEGRHFDYHLSVERGHLFRDTIVRDSRMSPTWLAIIDKKDRKKELGTACLYFDDTALLDHLLNVKLCASNASAELDMVKAFHITSVTKRFFDDPLLPDLKGVHDPVTAPLTMVENIYREMLPAWRRPTQDSIMFGPLYTEAKIALMALLRFPRGYLTMINRCRKYNFWDIVFDHPGAMRTIEGKLESSIFH